MQNDGMFKKIKSKSVVQTVVDSITKAIIAGDLKPGDKIPTEMELAESFGVGRNSIREAIKILVYYGVLEIRRAEGTFVCDGFNKIMIDPMIYGVILHQSRDYVNLMELREMMEVGVMRLAIVKYEESELEKLREKLDILREEIAKGPENVENVFIADNVFHDTVSEMGHNPIVDRINNVVREMTHKMRYLSVKNMLESGRGEELRRFTARSRNGTIPISTGISAGPIFRKKRKWNRKRNNKKSEIKKSPLKCTALAGIF